MTPRSPNLWTSGSVITAPWVGVYLQSSDVDIILLQGPELDPDECGAPILCIFYGLLGTIFLFAIYSNIKGNSHSEY